MINHNINNKTKILLSPEEIDNLESSANTVLSKVNLPKLTSVAKLIQANAHSPIWGKKWNPKSKVYTMDINHHRIFNPTKVLGKIAQASAYLKSEISNGRKILFVATNVDLIKNFVKERAEETDSFFVNKRWLGGTLTNFKTISQSIKKFNNLKTLNTSAQWEKYSKKEQLLLTKKTNKLDGFIGGISSIHTSARGNAIRTPLKNIIGAVVVADYVRELNAVNEAKKLGIPVIALTNTNAFPRDIDFVIPNNTNSIQSVWLILSILFDTIALAKNHPALVIGKNDEEIKLPINIAKEPKTGEAIQIVTHKKRIRTL